MKRPRKIATGYEPLRFTDVRDFDWHAVDDATYDGPGCPIGWGPTKRAAVRDLVQQIREREE